ncbi:MAG: glutamine--tRNA ligase/YqeY domain fusion protein [Clostridia bacterium]
MDINDINSNFIHEIIDEDLKNGKVTDICTRFPPEPNGYLHIGSAKAIFINWSIAKKYGGKFNLRFDDTNPVKEEVEFVESITEDLEWLIGEKPSGGVYFGSDYFEKCYELAVDLIKAGKAFVCDLSQDEMREYRGTLTEKGKDSPYKNRSIEENLELFEKMKNGEFDEGSCALRAKIDMSSSNTNMRDPVIYRVLKVPHHRQGSKWNIYPMYDFAHTIQDALEGVSHSLCSIEFVNHRPLYDWVRENLDLPANPHQYEFARMNVTHTVMSKRYLRELVEKGYVDGWDDPRMPTLSGLRRRGYTPTAIMDFVKRSGVARSVGTSDVRLLEHCVREELNETCVRRVAVLDPIKVTISNYPDDLEETFSLQNNPQDPEAGRRDVPFSKEIFIDREDFSEVPPPKYQRLKTDNEVRLMGSYIIKLDKMIKDANGNLLELVCTADLETRNNMPADGRKIKGTIHWVSAKDCLEAEVYVYDHLFTAENIGYLPDGENYLDYINENSLKIHKNAKLEPAVLNDENGTRMQFVRMGYFVKDSNERFNKIVSLKDTFAKNLK